MISYVGPLDPRPMKLCNGIVIEISYISNVVGAVSVTITIYFAGYDVDNRRIDDGSVDVTSTIAGNESDSLRLSVTVIVRDRVANLTSDKVTSNT